MAVYACSDLHGRLDLYKQIKAFLNPEDTVYFLGDAGDRGPDSWELIKTIYSDDQFVYLMGNHEEMLVEAMKDDNQDIYQWRRKYVRKNKSGVVPTLTANQGEGGHNVCLIKTKNGIRKMTPHECFNVQGFPKDFVLPEEMSDAKLYKQAGNSVCVSVIQRIAENIKEAVEETEKKEKTA